MINTTKQYLNDGLIIEYSDPSIQAFHEGYFEPITKKDILYFYYTVQIYRYNELDITGDDLILAEKELIFEERTHDFPKVDSVPGIIDYIVNEPCTLKLKDYEDNGYHQIQYYNQVDLMDYANCEYWYKIERYDTKVKQRSSNEYRDFKYYTLTIGNGFGNMGYSNKKDNGAAIYLSELKEKDLLEFKKVCEEFMESAIETYNESVKNTKLKCPHCNKYFNLCGTNIKDERNDYIYKCSHCSEIVDESEYKDFWKNILKD